MSRPRTATRSLDKTTDNALRVLALVGRTDVPVAMGADRPLVVTSTWPLTSTARAASTGPELQERASEPVEQDAVDFLVEHVTPETVLDPSGR